MSETIKPPTRQEIARRTAEIRAGWSDAERCKRGGSADDAWTPPAYRVTESLKGPVFEPDDKAQ